MPKFQKHSSGKLQRSPCRSSSSSILPIDNHIEVSESVQEIENYQLLKSLVPVFITNWTNNFPLLTSKIILLDMFDTYYRSWILHTLKKFDIFEKLIARIIYSINNNRDLKIKKYDEIDTFLFRLRFNEISTIINKIFKNTDYHIKLTTTEKIEQFNSYFEIILKNIIIDLTNFLIEFDLKISKMIINENLTM